MSNPGFETVTLADACRLITDGSHFSPTPIEEGYTIVNAKDIPRGRVELDACTRISEREYLLLKNQNCAPVPGDVLLSKDGTIGRVVHYKEDLGVVLLSSVAILRPNALLTPAFLAHSLRSHFFDQQLFRLQSGSALKRLVLGDIRKIRVPVVKLEIQNAIAEILSTLDETIEQTEALITKYQRIKAGLMHDLFTRGVTPNGHLRPSRAQAPHLYKESPLGWIPKEWEVNQLGAILKKCGGYLQTGPFGSQLHAHEYQHEGVPVVMPQDINDGVISSEQIARISGRRAEELSRHRVKTGDIVIARRGELTRSIAITELQEGWVCGTGCFLLRLGRSALHVDFASAVYRHDIVQRQIAGMAVGTTMPSLNNTVMERLLFPYCDPDEQLRITKRLDSLDLALESYRWDLDKLKLQKHGLMHDLLTGRVRVNVAEAENV